nr:retrovirus-related Pol polyprotein from transposon TNT 1-94 [Tanacetum cinerariifolium]
MRKNSQGKKHEVEDQRRNVKLSKNKTSVTTCNVSLNAKTSNVNSVCATCDTCMLNDKHDMCVLNSVAKPNKKTVALESNQKPKNITRQLYERVSKTCSWWYPKFTPLGYKWKPKSGKEDVNLNVSMPLGNESRTANILEHTTSRKSTCYICDLKGNDLLTGSRGTYLNSITLQDTNSPNLVCLMAKATSSQAWLWHRRLSYLNFDSINLLSKNIIVVGLPKLKCVKDHLCSFCELGKAKRKDGENLDKMKEKGDECIFVGYSTQSRAYRVFNKRTRVIMESIHVNFDELPHMASDHVKTYAENDQVADDEFINIFCTPIQDQGETSSRHSVRTRRQLESDGEMCMFALTVSRTEPKNIKEANVDSAWIESMQEELHQFNRLDEEVYVNHLDGFVDPYHPDQVYRLKKALYALKQAPRAWYDELSKFLLSKDSPKSTSGGIQFLGGDKLVSWSSKKQDCTLMSSAEAEYVSLSACCVQVLWMRTQLTDYGFYFDKIPMYCDSEATIAISCNPVQHSHTKHIDVKKGIVELFFVGTEY